MIHFFPSMRVFKTILSLIALFALMGPCIHADDHHHDSSTHMELCSVDHADCHSCSDQPCARPDQAIEGFQTFLLDIPVRNFELISILETRMQMFWTPPRLMGDLWHLQTVQLLI